MPDDALVSCLMVTKPRTERLSFLKESISAFLAQTYPHCELVIVLDQADEQPTRALQSFIAELNSPSIRLLPADGTPSLGALRNKSVDAARGQFVCQWDDDDMHHPERVARQLDAVTSDGKQASYLQDLFQFVTETRQLFWTNWLKAPVPAHPGTLLCARDVMPRYPETGPLSQRGEDRDVLERLEQAGHVTVLQGAPHLFVYRMHSTNLSPHSHLQMLYESLSVSAAFLLRRKAAILAGLAVFDFGTDDVFVTGWNGPAFTIPEPALP